MVNDSVTSFTSLEDYLRLTKVPSYGAKDIGSFSFSFLPLNQTKNDFTTKGNSQVLISYISQNQTSRIQGDTPTNFYTSPIDLNKSYTIFDLAFDDL